MKELLPNGSVVLLKNSTKKIMITGRLQRETGVEDQIWDYCACLYPEGILNPDQSFLFQHEQIERVYFIGFQDEEELAFREFLKQKMSERL
ncbi:DUF4176 domain-containing protein [Paenibacillus aurantiacus]|uniref:DUF4176 domain-containing protein n=1 Tax=Paenibacillus aurantiacus TaxID=1936118 RepID=A0ABV5KIE5_9BACL